MPPYQPEDTEFIKSLDADAPKFTVHGLPEDIRERLRTAKTWNWNMVGPGNLVCQTDYGTLTQRISADYICLGTGPDGMPLLQKIKL